MLQLDLCREQLLLPERTDQPGVDLHAHHATGAGGQRAGQDAEPGADLEHRIAGSDARHPNQLLRDPDVVEEVLPSASMGSEAVALEEGPDLAGGHPSDRRCALPWPRDCHGRSSSGTRLQAESSSP